jgi:effector-binding domain-containing protein
VDHEVRLLTVAADPTAVVAAATTWAEFPSLWGHLLDEVYAVVRADETITRGHNVMLYLDDLPHVEVGIQVAGTVRPSGRVVASALPAGRVAATVHRGSYDGLDAAHRAVHDWCALHGHALTGVRWEIYGDWREDQADMEIEIRYLLRDGSA